jgi:hypothetical protein
MGAWHITDRVISTAGEKSFFIVVGSLHRFENGARSTGLNGLNDLTF